MNIFISKLIRINPRIAILLSVFFVVINTALIIVAYDTQMQKNHFSHALFLNFITFGFLLLLIILVFSFIRSIFKGKLNIINLLFLEIIFMTSASLVVRVLVNPESPLISGLLGLLFFMPLLVIHTNLLRATEPTLEEKP